MAAERKQLILVDGSGYIFRAFHALPPMNTSHGLPTQAVYGFIRMLLKLLKDVRPSHIAIVFDSPKRTFRDDLFADYKANRSEAPNDLIVQIPYIHRAVEAFRIKSLMIEGFEADDVIGTLAKRAAKEDFVVTLITADKDFMQLVGPHVTLWDTMRDRRIGAREVRERFGVEPSALVDIQALTGDTIDNIKGVPGVGEKTAAALIQKFGSIKELYENLERIEESGIRGAKKIAALLGEHRASVDLARKLVRIDTEVALSVAPDEFAWVGVDEKVAAELLRELEFHSIIREISPSQVELPGFESNTAAPATAVVARSENSSWRVLSARDHAQGRGFRHDAGGLPGQLGSGRADLDRLVSRISRAAGAQYSAGLQCRIGDAASRGPDCAPGSGQPCFAVQRHRDAGGVDPGRDGGVGNQCRRRGAEDYLEGICRTDG